MAMPSSASTIAICVSRRLIETLCRDTTPGEMLVHNLLYVTDQPKRIHHRIYTDS